jgi:glutamate---cysteine ligase / carboxylate-amine ligase
MIVTLGVEEELQVVDARTRALTAHDFELMGLNLSDGAGGIGCEIHRCTVELQTPIHSHPDNIAVSLSVLRGMAREQAAQKEQAVLAAGLHPFTTWKGQSLNEDSNRYPHYAHLLKEYGDIARSAMSFGLHIHLGFPDPKLRMPVMNALRAVLPEVLALSASSPFHEGRDTGLACWRHSVLGQYPRMGIPETWPSEDAYFAHIDRLRRVGSLEPDQGMWDDLRLHHRYGTLEVRICDAVHSLERVWLIAALLQCEAMILAEEVQSGRLREPVPRAFIVENKWRARRYGLNASLVDWQRDEAVATSERYGRWVARLLPAAMELGIWPRLELAVARALSQGSVADQQRGWHKEAGSFESLVEILSNATAEPWTPPSRTTRYDAGRKTRTRRPSSPAPADLRVGHAPAAAAGGAALELAAAPGRPALSDQPELDR